MGASLLALAKSIYYIHTEKYSSKSYVVNFRTQISSSQSEERTMVFTRVRKMIRPIRSQEVCEIRAKIPAFYYEKSFTQRVFLAKKVKNIRKWSGIVSFVSLSIKKTVESRRNNSGKG